MSKFKKGDNVIFLVDDYPFSPYESVTIDGVTYGGKLIIIKEVPNSFSSSVSKYEVDPSNVRLSINNKRRATMTKVKDFFKGITLGEPQKSYIKYGLMTDEGEYTKDVKFQALEQLTQKEIATAEFQATLGQFVEEAKQDD